MDLIPSEQETYYTEYWEKIEKYTSGKTSRFVRDYISVKTQVTPTISTVYKAFKEYRQQFTAFKPLANRPKPMFARL